MRGSHGRPGKKLIGVTFLELLPEDERPDVLRHLEAVASGDHDLAQPYEHRVICADGSIRWQQWVDLAVRDKLGRVIEFQSVGRDITERKQAEEARAERVRFETLLDDLSAALVELPEAEVDQAIQRWLGRLAEALEFERAVLSEVSPLDGRLRVRVVVGCPGVPALTSSTLDDILPWVAEELRQNRTVILDDPAKDLPPEALRDREYCTGQGITAAVLVPLALGGRRVGAIEFASFSRERRSRSRDTMLQLRRAGGLLASALMRQRSAEALRTSEALNRSILSSIESLIVVLDRSGSIIATNPAWEVAGHSLGSERPATGIAVGADYLAACRRAATSEAMAAIDGIEGVLIGSCDRFQLDYLCPAPDALRWFRMAVTPLGDGLQGAVITHTDITALKRAEEELRELSGRLIHAEEKATLGLALELHDNVAQRLALLGLGLNQLRADGHTLRSQAAETISSLIDDVAALGEEIDGLVTRLHPFELEHSGLVAALRALCIRLAAQHQVTIDVAVGAVPARIPGAIALALYRIAQEALRNALRHSGADTIRVELDSAEGNLQLVVGDRGRGFDPAGLKSSQARLGLISMRERTRLINGAFELVAAPGCGVQVRVQVPHADGATKAGHPKEGDIRRFMEGTGR